MSLSLAKLGHLKSRAERDAKAYMTQLLALRKKGSDGFMEAGVALRGEQIAKACGEVVRGLSQTTDLITAVQFYVAEFDRQAEALMDVLTAATGKVDPNA